MPNRRSKAAQVRLPMALPETNWERESRRRGAPAEIAPVRFRRLAREREQHERQKSEEARPLAADVQAVLGGLRLRRVDDASPKPRD